MRIGKRYWALGVLMSLSGAPVLTAQAADAVTITWLTHRVDLADNKLTDLAKVFMKENPGIKVQIEAVDTSDLSMVLTTKMAANELPDVTTVLRDIPTTDLPKYFLPLDDLGFNPSNFYFYNNLVAPDGKVYGFNQAVNPVGVIYSKPAFKKAGITTMPKTLDELLAVSAKLKKAGIIPFSSSYKDKWPLQIYSEEMLWSMQQTGDVSYKNKKKDSNQLFVNNEPGGLLDAFKFIRKMVDLGYMEPDLTTASFNTNVQRMARNEIGMWYAGTWYPTNLVGQGAKADDIGMFNYPGAKGVILADDKVLGVAKNSKHPAEAKKFLKWLLDESRLAFACNSVSPLKNAPIKNQWVAELMKGQNTLEMTNYDPTYAKIHNEAELDLTAALQDYLLSKNPQSVVDRINAKWAGARKSLGL